MKIYLGSDHNGYKYKEKLEEWLKQHGYEVVDKGDDKLDSDDDFPQYASRVVVGMLVADEPDPRGILICGSGQGMVMAANRYKGIRASLCWNKKVAQEARNDDDSNVLCIAERHTSEEDLFEIVQAWLDTPFAKASRFIRRNQQLDNLN